MLLAVSSSIRLAISSYGSFFLLALTKNKSLFNVIRSESLSKASCALVNWLGFIAIMNPDFNVAAATRLLFFSVK